MIKVECISDEHIISELLTIGKIYECSDINTIGDCKIVKDDTGKTNWYKTDFFKDIATIANNTNVNFVKAKI